MIFGIEFSRAKHEGKTFIRVAPYIHGVDKQRVATIVTSIVVITGFIIVATAISNAQ